MGTRHETPGRLRVASEGRVDDRSIAMQKAQAICLEMMVGVGALFGSSLLLIAAYASLAKLI